MSDDMTQIDLPIELRDRLNERAMQSAPPEVWAEYMAEFRSIHGPHEIPATG
jgi:hypothetical protein